MLKNNYLLIKIRFFRNFKLIIQILYFLGQFNHHLDILHRGIYSIFNRTILKMFLLETFLHFYLSYFMNEIISGRTKNKIEKKINITSDFLHSSPFF